PPRVRTARRNRLPGAAWRRARARGPDARARRRSGARGAAGSWRPRLRGAALLGAGGPGDGSASPPRHRAGRLNHAHHHHGTPLRDSRRAAGAGARAARAPVADRGAATRWARRVRGRQRAPDRGSAAAHRARRGARGYGARHRPPHRIGPRTGQGAAAARQGSDPVTKPMVRDLVERRGQLLQLETLTGDVGLDREIPTAEASSPGLVLAGYTKRFVANRIHILGETEVTYLASLDAAARRRTLERLPLY